MGYKTKSMIYAKSLKAGLHFTGGPGSGPDDNLNKILEADKADKAKVSDNIGIIGGNGDNSLIKKTPEKKERTKRENRKSAKEDIDSGVLSGLASGSKGTQTGTALGIIFNKIKANKVAGTENGAAKKESSNVGSATSTGFGAKKGFDSKIDVELSDNFKEDISTPDFNKKKASSGDLSKMASGSQERIAEYKKRNWAMDATTGSTVKKSKVVKAKPAQKLTGNVATKHSSTKRPGSGIGKQGSSNVGKKVTTIKPTRKIVKPGKSNVNTPKNKETEEGTRFLSNKWFQESAENSTFFDPKRLSLEQIKKRQLKQKL